MIKPTLISSIAAGVLLAAINAGANVTLPAIFGDHMMMSADKPLVWGYADPGEQIQVALGKDEKRTEADAQGNWRVEFPAQPVTTPATTLVVAGKNSRTIQDVVFGDIWVASGQSNMAFALGWLGGVKDWLKARGEDQALTATNPRIRVYFVGSPPSVIPDKIGRGEWKIFSPDAARDLSAVAYFFAEKVQQKTDRPIGIINVSAGGTAIESWSSKESLSGLADKKPGLDKVAAEAAAFPTDPAAQTAMMDDFHKRDNDWVQTIEKKFHADYDQWTKDRDAAKAAGKPLPPEPPYPQTRPKNPMGEGNEYTTLFYGMINPVIPYPIKGVIWYQGEANGPNEYDAMLRNMVTDWRKRWGDEFAFLPVMLANIGPHDPANDGWVGVRDAQERVSLELPKMGTASASDVGMANNIHPYDKIDVGQRLAAQALRIVYGQDIVSSGPRFGSMKVEGSKIRVTWKDTGTGLQLAVSPCVNPDNAALPTDKPLAFDIAGADKKWVVAEAKLDGNDVIVWSDQVPAPVAVRYAWCQNPEINLYNKEGFPAVQFRTEDWPNQPPPK